MVALEGEEDAPWQSGPLFTTVPHGTREFLARDARGKVLSVTATVPFEVAGVNISSVVTTATSFPSVPDGTLRIVTQGGFPPFAYSINYGFPQTNATFRRLIDGPYRARVTDSRGCTAEADTVVPYTPIFVAIAPTQAGCTSTSPSNGKLEVRFVYGAPPHTLRLGDTVINGTFASSWTFTNLLPTTHRVEITDSVGNERDLETTIPGYVPTVEGFNVRPADPAAGGIISIAHVISGAQFALDDQNGVWQSASIFENVTAGDHKIYVRDGDGCPNQYDVYVPPLRASFVFSLLFLSFVQRFMNWSCMCSHGIVRCPDESGFVLCCGSR
jgi:hypothetical protein